MLARHEKLNPLRKTTFLFLELIDLYSMEEYSEGEEGLFEKIKNRFLDFIELLKEHKMPVAALAAVITILLIALLVFGKPATADVRVNVMLGTSPAEGAVVELLDSGLKIASAKTVGGSVSFKSVPVTLLLAKASKKGAGSASKELDLTKGAREFSLTLRQEIIEGSVNVFVIDSAANAPVEGARVEYALEQETGEATTDSNGTATLTLTGSGLIRLRVSKTGFDTNVLSVLASKETIIVKLDPQEPEPSIPLEEKIDFQNDLTSYVSTSVSDDDGNPVSEGTVRVYDFDSLLLLGQANLAEGSAVVENIPSDANVFVNVESLEFLPYYGVDDPKPVDSGAFFAVTLSRAALDVAETHIRTVDEENNLVASKMFLLVPPASILSEKDSVGEWTLKISPDLEYYAAANAEGFLPARSDSFTSGDDVTISMTKATAENSASLKVIVSDEDGNALPGASVSIATRDGLFVYPQAFTDENGEATFSPLALGEEYEVTTDYLGNTATASVLLQQDSTVRLAVELIVGVLKADAFDTATLEQIEANASIFEGKVLKAKCVTPCALRVRAGRELTFKANAASYLNFESVFTVEIGESVLVNASLTKIKDATKPWVSLDSVENAKNASETNASAFAEGNEYKIKLSFGGPNESNAIGVFFRAGDLENVDLEPIGVTQIPTANLVYRSTVFLPDDANDAGECVDLLDDNTLPSADGLYKWFGLEFSGNANRQIEFLVKTKQNAWSFNVSKTSLHYSAYAVVESAGKKVYLRSPEDPVLGTDFSSPAKQWCHPTAFAREFGISFNVSYNETLNATPTPNATALPSITPPVNLTESASIWIDHATGEVKSNVEEIVMQADSIFPADAIPVDLQQQQGCTLLYQFTGSDFVNCFGYDEANKKLWFKSRDFNNPSCAAKVKGNSIDSAEVTLTFTAACTQKTFELPVRVEPASFESIYGAPDSLSAGPGSAKLVYAINELQAPRTLEVKNGVARSVNVASGSVTSIAWSGPGTLSLTHEGESIKQWTYTQNSPVFGARGDLGSRTKSCSDFLCCASAWCNPTAFQQAYTAFKVKAGEIASATAFRRGEGEPWAYLAGGKNFEFASIAQVVENAKEILTQADAPQPSVVPEECKPGNPAIYELRASTSDLKSWSYSTKVLRLEHNLQSTQNTSLCNFLQGDGKNVTQTNTPSLASNEQSSDDNSMPKVIPSFFVSMPPGFKTRCESAGTKFIAAQREVDVQFDAVTASTCTFKYPPCAEINADYTAYQTYTTCLEAGSSATCGG
ncbi:carboxypeptidase regulatory-like domain-containing protein, partial [Candidatus Micrarchaeota archaeon]|nr:carboxypeptidase regulatory-like domain-containing protein [Candidatus Micrarchaeota archaeon]